MTATLRKPRRIGGSLAAAVCGIGARNKHTAYARLLGLEPEGEGSEAMWWGTRIEPIMAERYTNKFCAPHGLVLNRSFADHEGPGIDSPEYEWMSVHPDGLVFGAPVPRHEVGGGPLKGAEFKVAGFHAAREWGEQGQVPEEYYLQCLHAMVCTNLRTWDLCVLLGTEMKLYTLEYDDGIAQVLIENERKFWEEHLLPNVAPPADGSDACTNLMKWRFPRDTKPLDFVDTNDLALFRQLFETHKNLGAEEENYAQLSNQCKAIIGDREGLRWDGGRVLWRANKKGVRSFRIDAEEM